MGSVCTWQVSRTHPTSFSKCCFLTGSAPRFRKQRKKSLRNSWPMVHPYSRTSVKGSSKIQARSLSGERAHSFLSASLPSIGQHRTKPFCDCPFGGTTFVRNPGRTCRIKCRWMHSMLVTNCLSKGFWRSTKSTNKWVPCSTTLQVSIYGFCIACPTWCWKTKSKIQ